MSLKTQAKVLRALQEGRIEPVGGGGAEAVDVRVITATNKDLTEEIRCGRFREDLYFRLAVVPLRIPPLRERSEELIPMPRPSSGSSPQYGRPLRRLAPRRGRPCCGTTGRQRAGAEEPHGAGRDPGPGRRDHHRDLAPWRCAISASRTRSRSRSSPA